MKKTTNVFKICTKKWLNKLLLDFAKYLCSGSNHVSFRFQLQEDTTYFGLMLAAVRPAHTFF